MADRNEADALFATKRKKQQEEPGRAGTKGRNEPEKGRNGSRDPAVRRRGQTAERKTGRRTGARQKKRPDG